MPSMTKKELVDALKDVPDDAVISVVMAEVDEEDGTVEMNEGDVLMISDTGYAERVGPVIYVKPV